MCPTATTSTHAQLHIRLLGGFDARVNGQVPAKLESGRTRELLTYLIVRAATPIARKEIAFTLWPETSDKQAQSNLRTQLARLRKALGPAAHLIAATSGSIHLAKGSAVSSDVHVFQQIFAGSDPDHDSDSRAAALERAVALYRGDLLPGCYTDWITSEREQLHNCYLSALAFLVETYSERHWFEPAIDHARRLLQADPLREAPYLQLMQLHTRCGDRAAALRVYHQCADTLRRELDVEPGHKLAQVYRQLVNQPVDLPEAGRLPDAQPGYARLIGRAPEWSKLQESWRHARRGKPILAVISGEAGIGKTRLAEELLAWAQRQGIATAPAHCYAAEQEVAFDPLVQWLEFLGPQKHWESLDQVWRAHLGSIAPHLVPSSWTQSTMGAGNTVPQRRMLFEALTRLLLPVDPPTLLLLDDLQWCDRVTLDWLHSLMRAPGPRPVLIVATVRSGAVDSLHPCRQLQLAWQRRGSLVQLPLLPLSKEESATLASSYSQRDLPPAQLAELYRETEGNPLFVVETLQSEQRLAGVQSTGSDWQSISPAGDVGLPPKMAAVLHQRLAQLTLPTRKVIQVAAVVGRAFTFEILAQVSGQPEDEIVEGVDEAWRRRIIREQGADAYDFSHGKLRSVAYAELSLTKRRRLHQRVAATLAARASSAQYDEHMRSAQHYVAAGEREQAWQQYRRATVAASDRYAVDAMLTASTHALALLHELDPNLCDGERLYARAALIDQRIWGWEMTGNTDAYLDDLTLLQRIGRNLDQTALADRAARYQSALFVRLGRYHEAEAVALAAAARQRINAAPKDEGISLTVVGRARRELGNFDGAVEAFALALRALEAAGAPVYQIQAYSYLSTTYWKMGDYHRALAMGEQALALCAAHGMTERRRFPLGDMGAAAAMLEQPDQARRWLDESLHLAQEVGDAVQEAFCRGHLGALARREGAYAAAATQLQLAVDLSRSAEIADYESWLLRELALVTIAQDQSNEALTLMQQARAAAETNHQPEDRRAADTLILQLLDIDSGAAGRSI